MARQRLTPHLTDEDHPTISGRIRRTIRNWHSYVTPGGLLLETDAKAETAPDAPPDWSGSYDFSIASVRAPLQLFFRDKSDNANRVMWGCRISHRPNCWLNWKALGANAAVAAQDPVVANGIVSWVDLWTNADLRLVVNTHRVDKQIILKSPGHPATFRFSLRLPTNFDWALVDGCIRITDNQGVERLRTLPGWCQDANEKSIRCAIVEGQTETVRGRTYSTFVIRPNPSDLATAVYPVVLDPTTTISGTTDIDDVCPREASPDVNYGASTSSMGVFDASTNMRRPLVKMRTGAIPAGTINTLTYYCQPGSQGTVYINRIVTGNQWNEGTNNGGVSTGDATWNHRQHPSTNWLGSAGCTHSTTDYATSPEYSLTTHNSVVDHIDLDASWATNWRDGGYDNNGIVMRPNGADSSIYPSGATLGTGNYFIIDYTAGGGGISIPVVMGHRRSQGMS